MAKKYRKEKKFYLTVYRVEVLSDEPIPSTATLADVAADPRWEDSTHVEQTEQETVNGLTMVKLLQERGLSPAFFGLTEDGEEEVPGYGI